jgi:hypothetical protein
MLLNIVQGAAIEASYPLLYPIYAYQTQGLSTGSFSRHGVEYCCKNLPFLGLLVSNAASGFTGVTARRLPLQEEDAVVS